MLILTVIFPGGASGCGVSSEIAIDAFLRNSGDCSALGYFARRVGVL